MRSFAAELDGGFEQQTADAASAGVFVDAESADLAFAGVVLLYADHANDLSAGFLGDPEVVAGRVHVGRSDIVDVEAGVVVGDLPADDAGHIEAFAHFGVGLGEAADSDRWIGAFIWHDRGILALAISQWNGAERAGLR